MAHRVLIVANRTLGSDEVIAAARERVQAGATELWIVAPATPLRDATAAIGVISADLPVLAGSDPAYQQAEKRLHETRDRMASLGVPVGGEVGDADAFKAVGEVLKTRQFDEILVATLPKHVSHWLRADLPSRLHRKHNLPVTTVTTRTP